MQQILPHEESSSPSALTTQIFFQRLGMNLPVTSHLRSSSCLIKAHNDAEAIHCWLKEYSAQPATFRTYQKEAERFLLWCTVSKHQPLALVRREEMGQYLEFLANPHPREQWCAPKGGKNGKRGSESWRPFVGPLSARARESAISVLNSLFEYLVEAQYLSHNPIRLMRSRKITDFSAQLRQFETLSRILEDDEWEAFLATLQGLPETSQEERAHKERCKYLVSILFLLGLRIHEVEKHHWNAFRCLNGDWWFFVKGKGGKLGKIPVNPELLAATQQYRSYLGLSALPSPEDAFPIIASFRSQMPLSTRQMHRILKEIAIQTAEKWVVTLPHKTEKMKRFSPHWLRHLSASKQDRAGIRFTHIKANHRHSKDDTTRLYVHAEDKERHEEMAKLKLFAT